MLNTEIQKLIELLKTITGSNFNGMDFLVSEYEKKMKEDIYGIQLLKNIDYEMSMDICSIDSVKNCIKHIEEYKPKY